MRARLGPQMPGVEKPRVIAAQEVYPGPLATLVMLEKCLDGMLSMPFSPRIINYEPLRVFIVPKFFTYDGSSDPFYHIMHYRQLMTLHIGNDALLCKVFPTNLQGQALS